MSILERRSITRAEVAQLGGAGVFASAALVWLVWLLWRYVPPHAVLFVGLEVSLPRTTSLVVSASNWFIRLFVPLTLLFVMVVRIFLMPLLRRALEGGERRGMILLMGVLATGGVVELGAGAVVLQAVDAGCSRAATDPRYTEQVSRVEEWFGHRVCAVHSAQ